jgi:hypothetical protein
MPEKFLTATALAGVLGVVTLPTAASAAVIEARPLECKNIPGCFLVIIDGDIKPDDDKKFEALIKKNNVKTAVVALNSPGGNLLAGIMIGKSIRERGYTTIVPGFATCMSACAAIWLAGSTRQVEAKSRIGFHAAYTVDKKGRFVGVTGPGNALFGSYYAHLGLSDLAILYLTSAAPSELKWLKAADAKKYGIEVEFRVDEKANYVVGPWPEKSETASNPPPATPAEARADDPMG